MTANARSVEDLNHEEYVRVLRKVRAPTLADAFGPDIECVKDRKYAIEAGRGIRSLAVVGLRGRPQLQLNRWGKLTLELNDPDTPCSLSMTDVRFYEPDHRTVDEGMIADVNGRLGSGVETFLMLGLARAFVAQGYDRSLHFLQANGLCLVDRAVGDIP